MLAERLLANDDTITKQKTRNHQTRLGLMAKVRNQVLREMREEIAKIMVAGDCVFAARQRDYSRTRLCSIDGAICGHVSILSDVVGIAVKSSVVTVDFY